MRWPVVLVLGYLFLAAEIGLREGLSIGPRQSAPSLVVPLLVFVALHAPGVATMWTALLLGICVDLSTQRGPDALVIVGPHALGFLLGAYFVLTVRGVMIKRNPWTLVVLSVLAALLSHTVVIAIFTFRKVYGESVDFVAWQQLVDRFVRSLLTGLGALLSAALLFPIIGVFGFVDPHLRRPLSRSR